MAAGTEEATRPEALDLGLPSFSAQETVMEMDQVDCFCPSITVWPGGAIGPLLP